MINIDTQYLKKFINDKEFFCYKEKLKKAHEKLYDISNEKNEFKGWIDLPFKYNPEELKRLEAAASRIKEEAEIFVVIGIGGSYLGARAAIEFLYSENYNHLCSDTPRVFFIGNSVSPLEIKNLLEICKEKDVCLNVISKSGTTTEPAIAFRIFKDFMEKKYGKSEAAKRIYCTTDKVKGALKKIADKENYECFEIPEDVGGRYSVLTAVGLLPIAVSGADIKEILRGAGDACKKFFECDLETNDCYKYAVLRNILYQKGKVSELLVGYEPRMKMFFEWWKQLFGESEGKKHKGIFPASAVFSTDLHSLGQFIQEGSPVLFETVLKINDNDNTIKINSDFENLDELNYLSGKTIDFVNEKAFEATTLAHYQGDVPNIVINIDNSREYGLGYLFYFFEKACAISAYLLGVNPFDQPGVEAYKNNMFKLLGKPGYC